MNKNKKINEAKYFLSQMENSLKVFEIFEYNLSAFLSASRSILQYSYEEVKINNKQIWYDNFVKSSSYIEYFKEKRDTNIHSFPIKTLRQHEFSKVLTLSLNVSISNINKDGETIEIKKNSNLLEDPNNSEYEISIRFKDWNGDEDVLELCKKYLNELGSFLEEGITKNFISV